MHSASSLKRLNEEITRRGNGVGVFPNEAAITPVVGAILAGQADEWTVRETGTWRWIPVPSRLLAIVAYSGVPSSVATSTTLPNSRLARDARSL